jgi:uncharacterized iron-regulated membrane protein
LSTVYVEPATGAVVRVDKFSELPLGARLIRLMQPLHFGWFGGKLGLGRLGDYVVKAVYIGIGLAVPALAATAYLMYWNRFLSTRFKRFKERAGQSLSRITMNS